MDLTYYAHKYIWWEAPEDTVTTPHRIIAQVMNLGTFIHRVCAARMFEGTDVL
jgi:hypothetical protein